jgi:hypothetical protein
MEKVLITTEKYNGQYVAFISADDNTIVGAGILPEDALRQAKDKGVSNPYLFYVPAQNMVQIYLLW